LGIFWWSRRECRTEIDHVFDSGYDEGRHGQSGYLSAQIEIVHESGGSIGQTCLGQLAQNEILYLNRHSLPKAGAKHFQVLVSGLRRMHKVWVGPKV
jgi:hypothetical protein